MKKLILAIITLTFVLILSACDGAASEADAPGTGDATQERSMPPEMELIVGTFKLDETEQAIDAEQAGELLPLWKALRSLSESETAASAEVQAIITQIQDTMTTEQTDAITAMELTMEDFSELGETLGIETLGSGRGNIDPEMQATREAAGESGGGRPEGLGGGQGPGGGDVDPTARETAIAERGGTRGANMTLNTTFLNAIIEFLENKTQ